MHDFLLAVHELRWVLGLGAALLAVMVTAGA